MTAFDLLSIGLLIAFGVANWWLPFRWGFVGMLVCHASLVVAYFLLAGLAMALGRYEYDGFLSHVGLLMQAVLLNCLLLPIGLVALWRRGAREAESRDAIDSRRDRGSVGRKRSTEA
jgi:hypothetical protein